MIKFVKVKDIEDIEYELAVKPITVATGRVLLGTIARLTEEAKMNANVADGITLLMDVFKQSESEEESNKLDNRLTELLPSLIQFFYDEILLILCDLVAFNDQDEKKLLNINIGFFETLPVEEIYPLIEAALEVNSVEKIAKLIKNFSSLLKTRFGQKTKE